MECDDNDYQNAPCLRRVRRVVLKYLVFTRERKKDFSKKKKKKKKKKRTHMW